MKTAKVVLRTDAEIDAAWQEAWDAVWWHRHQALMNRIASGDTPMRGRESGIQQGIDGAKGMEDKYGRAKLEAYAATDFDWGLLTGRLSALTWLMGAEWDESMDT